LDDAAPTGLAHGPADVRRVDAGAEPFQQGCDPTHLLGSLSRIETVLERRQLRRRDLPLDLGRHPVDVAVHRECRDPLHLPALVLLHQAGSDRRALPAGPDPAHPHDRGAWLGRAQIVGAHADRVRLAIGPELGADGVADHGERVAAVDSAADNPAGVQVRGVLARPRGLYDDPAVELVVHGQTLELTSQA
jgi:hypothetical protein